ncbi:hypothetical protein RB195_018008 [Necator americanus]|uniref:Transposase n=1 Tax=Necator americanus TaxID=51031 RepID=A0ABR1C7R6_NECAM
MPVVDPHHQRSQVYLSAIRLIMMYGSETWAAPSTIMERLDCTERKLLRWLHGYFWLRRPADRLVQRVLRSLSGSSWKKPPGRKRIWNSDEWIDSVQALAEDREGSAELCTRTAHLGEDAGNRVRR